MENNIVKLDPKEYGLQENKAKEIEAAFLPMIEKMKILETEYNQITSMPMSKETCKKARELRLRYVKIRTGAATIHKEIKASFVAGGKFVDGWKNTQLYASQGKENILETIEKHFERIEKERLENLQEERKNIYENYGGEAVIDFTTMTDQVWDQFILGTKLAYEKRLKAEQERLEAEKKAEEEIIAKEKAEIKERERIRKENEKLKKEKEKAEKKRQAEIAEHKAKLEKERLEQEKKLEAERKERKKVEAELQAKKDEEKRIENERMEKERQAKLAPDKEKLTSFSASIESLIVDAGKIIISEDAKEVLMGTLELLNKTLNYIEEGVKKL